MALQYVTPDGTLIVPGARVTIKVQPNNAGLATTGVLMLVGESAGGPAAVEEGEGGKDLYMNCAFGPDQKGDVVSKYISGPLVDAYNMAVSASADENIRGSVSRIVLAKTNTGVKAISSLTALAKTDGTSAGSAYGNLTATLAGKSGNMISRSVTAATSETLPSTGAFVLASPSATTTVNFRVNGGAVATASLSAGDTPAAMVSTLDAITGVSATGGASRGTLISTGSVTMTLDSGYASHVTGTFLVAPTVGDIVQIPTGSPFAVANEGTYSVTAASLTRIDLYKVRDAAANTITAPTTETVSITGATNMVAYSPVVITLEASDPVAGLGKSLEIAQTSTGTFSDLCYVTATAAEILAGATPATKATFVSVTGTPKVITSGSEYVARLNLVRQEDGISKYVDMGGDVILSMGYAGTTAQATISGNTMTITLTGGSSSSLSPVTVDLAAFKSVSSLCDYLNTLGGFTAAPETLTKGSLAPTSLDDGVYTFATDKGAKTGRVKADGYFAALEITNNAGLVGVTPPGVATKLDGLPAVASTAFLSGGSKGSTTQANFQAALDVLKNVRGNFLIPIFSNSAATDIANGATEAGSTYDIDSILAASRAHVLQMSTYKFGKPRQAFLSYSGTFNACRTAAGNLASARCALTIQKIKDVDANGSIQTFSSWGAAVKAAAMLAAGGYRDITGKYIAISGLVDPNGYNNQDETKKEDALKAGILVAQHEEDGGYTWTSDQNTYSVDSNFIFNSIQAMYAADVVAMTAQKRMEKAVKGQSPTDITASVGVFLLSSILTDLKDAKYLCPSDDAPKGFKSVVVKIQGNAMVCNAEIKVTTGIKFIPITFLVTMVQQSAQG